MKVGPSTNDNMEVDTGDMDESIEERLAANDDDESNDLLDSFEYLDTNNNNRIDAREWHGTVAAFNRLDVNNDDVLSQEELLAYRGSPSSLRR